MGNSTKTEDFQDLWLDTNRCLVKFGVSRNTWLKMCADTPGIPDPVIIKGRRYWSETELDNAVRELPREPVVWGYVAPSRKDKTAA